MYNFKIHKRNKKIIKGEITMATITEDFVSFETAKLLKEKGFNELCAWQYYTYWKDYKLKNYEHPILNENMLSNSQVIDRDNVTAPTLQMAMKWLREEHNLSIDVATYTSGFSACVWSMKRCNVVATENLIEQYGGVTFSLFHTYEEAVEVSLKYCLENLI